MLGVFEGDGKVIPTKTTQKFIDQKANKLTDLVKM